MDPLTEAIRIARHAGTIIMKYYSQQIKADLKEDKTIITQADLDSNAYICKELAKFGWPILSEENVDSAERLTHDRIWIVDPLDGTQDFVGHTDNFAVHIGLVEKNIPILGVVCTPVHATVYYAEKGKGAWMQKGKEKAVQIHASKKENNLIVAVSYNNFSQKYQDFADKMHVKDLRRVGSVGVKLILVAKGECDLTINLNSYYKEWDTCAPEIIVHEAGGIVTDICGKPLLYNQTNVKRPYGVLATNKACHTAAVNAGEKFVGAL
jgi:3'(2'), 5'-bisphosphate nucleotidase